MVGYLIGLLFAFCYLGFLISIPASNPHYNKEVEFYYILSAGFVACVMVNMPPKNCKTQSPDSDDTKCHKADELADLIAELCVSAPSETVKSCLRVYEYGKSIKQIEKELERETRDSLDQTAKFLEIPNYLDKTKKPLAHLIVCRIQILLPEDCNISHERGRIKLSEPTLVECEVCGQGVHRKCFLDLAANATGVTKIPSEIDAADFRKLRNPLNLPGIHFFMPCLPA